MVGVGCGPSVSSSPNTVIISVRKGYRHWGWPSQQEGEGAEGIGVGAGAGAVAVAGVGVRSGIGVKVGRLFILSWQQEQESSHRKLLLDRTVCFWTRTTFTQQKISCISLHIGINWCLHHLKSEPWLTWSWIIPENVDLQEFTCLQGSYRQLEWANWCLHIGPAFVDTLPLGKSACQLASFQNCIISCRNSFFLELVL